MFEEKIDIQEDKVVIKISCKKRNFATEDKIRWCTDPVLLLPKDLRNNLILVSEPDKIVSNIVNEELYTNTGTWTYKIEKDETKNQPQATKPTRTTRTTRTTRKPRKANKEN